MDAGILFAAIHVPREDRCIAEYLRGSTRSTGAAAKKLLRSHKQRTAGDKKSFVDGNVTYNLLTHATGDLAVFLAVTTNTYRREAAFECLGRVAQSYDLLHGDAERLNNELKRLVDDFSDARRDKMSAIKGAVDETRLKLIDNIDLVIDRGENIEDLGMRTQELNEQAGLFEGRTKALKWAMWRKRALLTLGIILIVLFILAIVIVMLCRKDGINVDDCKDKVN
jgi:hypothetical protein